MRPENTPARHPGAKAASAPEGIHLGELFRVLRVRRKIVYAFTAMTVAGAIIRQILYVPTFTAQTGLNIQKAEASPLQAALANLTTSQSDSPDRIQKYLSYLSSGEFYLAVAENLKFQDGYSLLNLTPPGELSLTRKKFWQTFFSNRFGGRQQPGTPGNPASNPDAVLVPVEKLAGLLQAVTTAEAISSDTIRIRVTTLDPFTSMVLVNTAAEVFVKKTGERDYNEVAEVKRFIQSQLDATTERLKRSELSLVEFKKRHNIISINSEQTAYSSRLGAIEGELESAKIKREQNQRLIDYYTKVIDTSEKRLISGGAASVRTSPDQVINRLRQQLDALRYKKVLMQAQGYEDKSWQMGEIDREIDRTAGMLRGKLDERTQAHAAEGTTHVEGVDGADAAIGLEQARQKIEGLRTENQALDAKIATVERSRGELMRSLGSLPKDEQVLLTLTRDVDLQFELYSTLRKKLQEVEIQQVALQSHIMISQRSELPPPTPRTNFVIKILFSLLVGVFLGGTTAFLLEAIDPTVKQLADLDFMEVVSLGTIPHVKGSSVRASLGRQSYRPDLLICKEMPESAESMAFKHVRAQVTQFRAHDGGPAKTLAIVSPERGDGKSFFSANLAISLSQLEKRVVLVDCDLRNPSQPFLFGYKEGDGLSSLLNLKSKLEEVVLHDRAPNLDILPAGWVPPNPTELISTDKFRVLLDHLRSQYDYVVLDCPPVLPVVDSCVLASLSDAVILSAGYRKTKKTSVLGALRKILQISHKHVYAVLNNVRDDEGDEQAYVYPVAGDRLPQTGDGVDVRAELKRFEDSLKKRKAG